MGMRGTGGHLEPKLHYAHTMLVSRSRYKMGANREMLREEGLEDHVLDSD